MSRIWRAAGFVGERVEGTASDRFIERSASAAPLQPRTSAPIRRSIRMSDLLIRRHLAILIALMLVLLLGGGALGRFVFPAKSALSGPSPQAQAASLFATSLAHQSAGHLTEAEDGYNKVIALDPLYYAAYYDLGVLYQQTNRTSDATLAYEKTLILNPTFQPALFNLAILDSTSDPKTAIALYLRIKQLKPSNASAVDFNLGLVYRETGSVAAGNTQLREAIKLDPKLASRIPSQYKPIG